MAILGVLWNFRGLIGTAIMLAVLSAGVWRVVYVFDHYHQDEAVIATQKTTIKTLGDQIVDIGNINTQNLAAFNRQIAAYTASSRAGTDRINAALAALDFAKTANLEAANAAKDSPTCLAQPAIGSALGSLRKHDTAPGGNQPGGKPAAPANTARTPNVR